MERLSNILLEKLNVLHMFDYLVGGDSLRKSKTDPFPLLNICEKLNTEISDSVMIGDSVTDLNAS